jgi:endonuclease/exonuclease/phosphatase family metal-dependent hydrolase
MTRVLSYNILAGGYDLRRNNARRTQQLVQIMRSAEPDIIGVIEATHPRIRQHPLAIEEIAQQLDMQLVMGADAPYDTNFQLALMTRLPVLSHRVHPRPGLLNHPLLEVCLEEAPGQSVTIFVTHLTAAFSRFRTGDYIRRREIQEILRIMAPLREQQQPHLLMGDFNSLAPGDAFIASNLLSYVTRLDERRRAEHRGDGNPHLDFLVPSHLHFLNPLLRSIPRHPLLRAGFNALASCYDARDTIRLLRKSGYVDCYRMLHPQANGFTCPAANPAGRIDYIFADPLMAQRLHNCYVINEGNGLPGKDASDHLAVAAEYTPVSTPLQAIPGKKLLAEAELHR